MTSMKNDNIVQLTKMKLQTIKERIPLRRLMISSWNKFEAMKIASRSLIQSEVLSNVQKRVVLKSVIHFWKQQQNF